MAHTLMLILCCLTHIVLLMLGTHYSYIARHPLCFLVYSAPIISCYSTHVGFWNAQHPLCFLVYSTPIISCYSAHVGYWNARHMNISKLLGTWRILLLSTYYTLIFSAPTVTWQYLWLSTNYDVDLVSTMYSETIQKWLSVLTLICQF